MTQARKCPRCGNDTKGAREGGTEYCTTCGGIPGLATTRWIVQECGARVKIGEAVTIAVGLPCPFCGKKCGATAAPHAAVIHEMPYCKDFERLDALEFITAARKAAQFGDGLLS